MVAGLIVTAFLLKFPKPAQERSATPAPIASKETAKPSSIPATAANEVVVEWASINTLTAPGYMVSAAPYLHRGGISVIDANPGGSEIVLVNNLGLYEGKAVYPTTSQNMLTQIKTGNVPASFTLKFAKPVESISVTRPALYPATDSGITHPAWSVHALGTDGRESGSQSERMIRSGVDDVSARTYTLHAPHSEHIAAVPFDSDPQLHGKPFAAFSAVLIERLTIVREPESSR